MYQKRNKIFEVLALYLSDYANRRLYLREIAKKANLPLKTAQNALEALQKENVLKSERSGKNKYFKLNLDNIKTKFYLLHAELYKTILFTEKYPLTKVFLKSIRVNNTLVVFGSFAKFTAGKDSDFDLLAISKKQQELPFHLLPYQVHEIELSEDSFTKSLGNHEPLIKEIENNHVILNGHSYFVNVLWGYPER